jgi:hypothetical protein
MRASWHDWLLIDGNLGAPTPAAILVVLVWDGGAVGAMLCLVGYLALLAAALGYRFGSGAWRRIEVIEPKPV